MQKVLSFVIPFIYLSFFHVETTQCQCIGESLFYQDSVCTGVLESVVIDSSYAGSTGFDFCEADISQFDTVISYPQLSSSIPTATYGISCVQDTNGNWYGFAKYFNLTTLARFDFGSSLNNTPTVNEVSLSSSNYSLIANSRSGIRFVFVNGIWYGITSFTTSRLAVISFEDGLDDSTLSVTAFFNSATFPSPADVDIEIVNDSVVIGVLNSNGVISMSNFAQDLNSPPVYATYSQVISSLDLSAGRAIEIIESCGDYHVFVTGITRVKLNHLRYGHSLFNTTPTYTVDATGVPYPTQMRATKLGGEWQLWVKHRNYSFTKFNLPLTLDSVSTSLNFNTADPNLDGDGFDIAYHNGSYVALSIDVDKVLKVIPFQQECHSTDTIIWSDSATVVYDSSGNTWSNVIFKDSFEQIKYEPFLTWVKQKPTASFLIDQFCLGDTTNFIDQSIGVSGLVNWEWNFGDSTSSNLPSPMHFYQDTGTYMVKLKVTDDNGCIDEDSLVLDIVPRPIAHVSTSLPCQGQEISIFDASTFTGISALDSSFWIINSTDTFNTNAFEYAFADTGIQSIHLITTSQFGCLDTLDTQIHVLPSPQVDLDIDSTCFGDTVNFINQTSSIVPFNNKWYFGDGDSSQIFSPSHYYNDTGYYSLVYAAVTAGQCSDTFRYNLRISQLPIAGITLPSTSICTGETNLFQDNSNFNGESLTESLWVFNNDSANSLDYELSSNNPNSNIPLYHRITVGSNCISEVSESLNIIQGIESHVGITSFCANDSIGFFNLSSIPNGQILNAQSWNFGDGTTGSGDSVFHVYDDSTSVLVQLFQSTTIGCSNTWDSTIRIALKPVLSYELLPPLCNNQPLKHTTFFTIDPMDSILQNDWIIDNDTIPVVEPLITTESGQSIQIIQRLVTAKGCIVQTQRAYTIHPSPLADVLYDTTCAGSNVMFSSGYDGTNYLWSWEIDEQYLISGPEPTFNFTVPGLHNVQLIIQDQVTKCADTTLEQVAVAGIDSVYINNLTSCPDINNQIELDANLILDAFDRVLWNVNGQQFLGTTISPVLRSGNNSIDVEFTSQHNCSGSLSKDILTRELPPVTPEFESDPANNLKVSGRIFSASWITSVLWEVNESNFTGDSFEFTFPQVGFYPLNVMVTDTAGCVKKHSYTLNVGNAGVDLRIASFSLTDINNIKRFKAQFRNQSPIKVDSFLVELRSNSGVRLLELVESPIQSGNHLNVNLNTNLVNDTSAFYCLRIVEINGNAIVHGDEACITAEGEAFLSDLFPNPAEQEVSFYIGGQGQSELLVIVTDLSGRRVQSEIYELSNSGRIMHRIDHSIDRLPSGYYTIQIYSEDNPNGYVRKLIKR